VDCNGIYIVFTVQYELCMKYFRLKHTDIKTVWTAFYVDQKYQSTEIHSLFQERMSLY